MKPSELGMRQTVIRSNQDQEATESGIVVNPALGAVVLDTGQLVAGWYDFVVSVGASVVYGNWQIQHRDATNAVSIHAWRCWNAVSELCSIEIPTWRIVENERIRVVTEILGAGNFSVGIQWVKRV